MTSLTSPLDLSRVRHHLPAGVLAALATGLLIMAPERFGPAGLLGAVAALQLSLILAWSSATGTRGYLGSLVIGAGAAGAADTVLVLQDEPDLGPLAIVLAGAFLAAVGHQLARSAPRRLATTSLAGVSTLVVTVVCMSAMLVVYRVTDGSAVYLAAIASIGAAIVVGHLVDLVVAYPRIAPDVPRGLLALLLSIGSGVAAAVLLSAPGDLIQQLGAAIVGAILGLVSALLAVAASYIVAERPRQGWSFPWLQAAFPIAGAAPIAYFLVLRDFG